MHSTRIKLFRAHLPSIVSPLKRRTPDYYSTRKTHPTWNRNNAQYPMHRYFTLRNDMLNQLNFGFRSSCICSLFSTQNRFFYSFVFGLQLSNVCSVHCTVHYGLHTGAIPKCDGCKPIFQFPKKKLIDFFPTYRRHKPPSLVEAQKHLCFFYKKS